MKILLFILIPFLSYSQNVVVYSGELLDSGYVHTVSDILYTPTVKGVLTVDSISYSIRPAALSAFVRTSGITTTTLTNKWYYLKGTFVNEDNHSFGYSGDTVQYQNGDYGHLVGNYKFSVTSDKNGTTLECGLLIGSNIVTAVLDSTSRSQTYMKTGGEAYNISGVISHMMMHDDEIYLVYRSDQAGANITTNSGGAILHQIP